SRWARRVSTWSAQRCYCTRRFSKRGQTRVDAVIANRNVILTSVVIPFLIMAFFTTIRVRSGNAVTAMPDVLVFFVTINLYFAVWPEPWLPVVKKSLHGDFRALSLALAFMAAMFFLASISVERRLIANHMRRLVNMAGWAWLPDQVRAQDFPYVRLIAAWC